MSKIWEFLKRHTKSFLEIVFAIAIIYFLFTATADEKKNIVLKDYKDGVQNHLVWSLKGQCYFVRPNDDVTVYLVPVPDCDRK